MKTLASLAAAGLLFGTALALAQTPVHRVERLPALGNNAVSDEDTTAIVANPANLAFLPGAEFRWSSIYLDESAGVNWQGHALAFGFPFGFVPVSTALRYDIVDPPRAADAGADGNYQYLTWGLALGLSDRAAVGFSLQRAFSDDARAADLGSWSFGLTERPWDYLGLAFVAHDINAPRNRSGGGIDRTFDLALALRPLGTRALDLGLGARFSDGSDPFWTPRATLGVDVGIGRVLGEFGVSDAFKQNDAIERAWLASLAFAFYLSGPAGSSEARAGSVFGNGLGSPAGNRAYNNVQTEFAWQSARQVVGVEAPNTALRLRLESTPDTRGHVALLRNLWDIADNEPRIQAVVLELRTTPADSFAGLQELRDAVYYLRRHGKRVLCHLEDASGGALYLCAAADRTLINPAGGIRFAGLRSRYMYYKGLLDKLGIRADFIRISPHKSAPEPFIQEHASDEARADHVDLLNQYERYLTGGIAMGRKLDVAAVRKSIANGPFLATEAKAAGFVDGYAFDDQLEDAVEKLTGRSLPLLDDRRADRVPKTWGNGREIAMVYIDGDMVDGRSVSIPLLGTKLVGSYTIVDALKKAREDPRVAVVVLRIESGGGSSMAADVMWRAVQLTARAKPVIVSMAGAAASGGYYIAAPGTRVFANPLTVTGSIGIFYGKADISQLLHRIGVTVETYRTAPRADAESIFRPFTPDERRELTRKIRQFYDMFLTRVADGRKMRKQDVDAVGQGRVWTGEQALQRRLVDELGGLRQALEYARRVADLPPDAPIVELPEIQTSLVGRLLGLEGVQAKLPDALPAELLDMARALAPFAVQPPDKPLAHMEMVDIGP